jgi:hypothetical protein
VPEVKKNAPFKPNTSKTSSPPPVKENKEESKPSEKSKDEGEPKLNIDQISAEFIRIKEEGNKEFKDKSFLMAAAKFTEGVSIYKKYAQIV